MEWFVNILYTGMCPPRDTSLDVFFPPLIPFPLAPSLPRSIPPRLAPFGHLSLSAVHASFGTFINPPSLRPLTLSPCLASSLPPSLPSIPISLPHPHHCSILPTLHPSLLLPSSLPAAVQINAHSVCCLASCAGSIVSHLARRGSETMVGSRQ